MVQIVCGFAGCAAPLGGIAGLNLGKGAVVKLGCGGRRARGASACALQ